MEAPAGREFQISHHDDNHQVNGVTSPEDFTSVRQQIGMGLTDDNFFHLTCHIDPELQLKIEKGIYVDLDKLLPKDKVDLSHSYSNETKLEWVQSEGSTYLVLAKKTSHINCCCRWEQATIYCSKNPNRSREIW